MSISEVKAIMAKGKVWYYQEFKDEEEYAVNLYDTGGDWVAEFPSLGDMVHYINAPKVKYPCRNCVYINACGDTMRTAPCTGRKTKRQKGEN